MSEKTTNVYSKIQAVKSELLAMNLKKSGENKYAWFKYYELADILPAIIDLCTKYGLFTRISFDNEHATLEISNVDNSEESVFYTSPMRELELKGCNRIQALGGVETYQRRYLYLNAFDLVENDTFDAVSWDEAKAEKKETTTATASMQPTARFNDKELEQLKANIEWLQSFKTSDELIKSISTKYKISKDMKIKIAEVRANV